jgi:hypothetical protein
MMSQNNKHHIIVDNLKYMIIPYYGTGTDIIY